MRREVLVFLIMAPLLLKIPPAAGTSSACLTADETRVYFPTVSELAALGLSGIQASEDLGWEDCPSHEAKMEYTGIYGGVAKVYVSVMVHIVRGFSEPSPAFSVYKFTVPQAGENCHLQGDEMAYTLECPTDRRDNITYPNGGMTVLVEHESTYTAGKIIGGYSCADDPSYMCSSGSPVVKVWVYVYSKDEDNTTFDTALVLGPSIYNLVLQKVSGVPSANVTETETATTSPAGPPEVSILSPADGQTIYFEPGKPLTFEIRVKVTDGDLTYAGAHYESGSPKVVMVGGELQPKLGRNGGVGSVTVTLGPGYLGNVTGVVKAYAKDEAGNDVERSITVYLREKTSSPSAPPTSSTGTSGGFGTSSGQQSGGEVTAGDPSKFGNLFKGIRSGPVLSGPAKLRMKATLDRLKGIGSAEGLEAVEIKTPYGKDVKVFQKDENVKAKKGSSLWFKLKYYTGKALDNVIDSASGALDSLVEKVMPSPVGLFKDYVKAYKDSQIFQGDSATQKTMSDLHVSKGSAESYNEMSGIEDRELSLSPYKNAVPSSPVTKPLELTIGALGTGFKKCLAHDYEWEFRKTAERALFYKKLGMKYRDIILRTIADVEEETSYDHKVQTMNAQSKGDYRDQETRIRYYINRLYGEGKI
ncbi:hypothetical protein A3L09_02015 [Thermococcus profundus]|uniref:Uncharacterized protein n=1 Tax=Thermococcus profundus TaxID=49899 RepID=A0A2Z2M9R4_THEPR|nr:hypothetical protein [Thermococcus profundus]ASJ02129.1 hypothetical protein A3L09_02015 [Thermococcus profundus]